MDHIDSHLASEATNADYPLALQAALAIGRKTLNRYYSKTDYSEVYRIAMGHLILLYIDMVANNLSYFLVLHPRHKLQYFKDANWTPEWINAAHEIVKDEYERKYAALGVEVSSDSEMVRRLQLTIYIST
jgi:hypothetical protein